MIEALQASGIPEHVDVAEILQNKLYYEAETLDMVVGLITKYNAQSYKCVSDLARHVNSCSCSSSACTRRYLDSVINLAYTLLRMLEKYSKSKAYMYVRKKRAGRAANARKKKRKSLPLVPCATVQS